MFEMAFEVVFKAADVENKAFTGQSAPLNWHFYTFVSQIAFLIDVTCHRG